MPQVGTEGAQLFQPFRSGIESLLLGLEELATADFYQYPDGFSYSPAGSPQHLQTIRRRHQQRDAPISHDAYALGKAVERLEVKSGEIDTLKLFGGIRHEKLLALSL